MKVVHVSTTAWKCR